jgi:hypothetical protein
MSTTALQLQVADEGDDIQIMKDSCECIEQTVVGS